MGFCPIYLYCLLRYLQSAVMNLDYEQYQLVEEALQERANLLQIAPHLSFPLPIMLPVYELVCNCPVVWSYLVVSYFCAWFKFSCSLKAVLTVFFSIIISLYIFQSTKIGHFIPCKRTHQKLNNKRFN